MRSKKLRITLSFLPVAALLVLAAISMPGALGSEYESNLTVTFEAQPTDAGSGETITSEPFDPTGEPVAVKVVAPPEYSESYESSDEPVFGATVTLAFAEGSAIGTLAGYEATTGEDGVATFPALSITGANEPFSTHYQLEATATEPEIEISGFFGSSSSGGSATSSTFDIWEAGCFGDNCDVSLTPGNSSLDTYTTTESVGMGASAVSAGVEISCPTQRVIFSSDVFVHVTTGNGPVFLVTHISRADMKAAANNGQKHVGWCVGLKTPGPWDFAQQDTNSSGGLDSGDFFVGLAPKCPRKNASSFAPCFVSKSGDDNGGSFIRGWVPGGDPPRRT
ncbi:MAG: hypothetical protein ACRDG8_08160 [Actinomycetota bacterium]